MGKRGSTLVPFLIDGLKNRKYGNYLRYVDEANNVIRVVLLRKSKNVCRECVRILKDWNAQKGHEVGAFDFTKAKQRFEAALRRSVYLKRVKDQQYPLTYKILSSEEVKENRKLQNKNKKLKHSEKDEDCYSPLSDESGYSSCPESPLPCNQPSDTEMDLSPNYDLMSDYESGEEPSPDVDCSFQSNSLLAAIQHDHCFSIPTRGLIVQDREISPSVAMDETTPTDSDLIEKLSGDFDVDFSMTDSEWQSLLNDVVGTYFSLAPDDLLNGNKDVIFKKSVMKKVYQFKCEQALGETTLMTCEPKEEEISIDADIDDPDLVVLDADLLKRIQRFQITKKMYEDNHLLLFLKPQGSCVEHY